MQEHIVKTFDIEITKLKESIMTMAKKCEHQLEKSIQALKLMDHTLAEKVVKADETINGLQREIEEQAVTFLATRQPLAVDLRQLLAVMRIASELERIADYAANVAKRVTLLSQPPTLELQDLIISMANTGRVMLHDAIMAFLMLDLDKAVQVWEKDDEIDANYTQTLSRIKLKMQEETQMVEDGTHLIFIARCCERIGDHVTNIAEDIYYIISGKNFLGEFE